MNELLLFPIPPVRVEKEPFTVVADTPFNPKTPPRIPLPLTPKNTRPSSPKLKSLLKSTPRPQKNPNNTSDGNVSEESDIDISSDLTYVARKYGYSSTHSPSQGWSDDDDRHCLGPPPPPSNRLKLKASKRALKDSRRGSAVSLSPYSYSHSSSSPKSTISSRSALGDSTISVGLGVDVSASNRTPSSNSSCTSNRSSRSSRSSTTTNITTPNTKYTPPTSNTTPTIKTSIPRKSSSSSIPQDTPRPRKPIFTSPNPTYNIPPVPFLPKELKLRAPRTTNVSTRLPTSLKPAQSTVPRRTT
ncbi:hypothetical protein E3P89_03228 [Wallemia ichthyophaga]|uniref:Uncharacterized protein n=1 Tax=Wallemia ichthyophaga TaxID=245174 RepID=A0A4V4LYC1_WALIC|nr:hypothetical protein E3P98_03252 [Wallemia ichthyophaga]TIB09434.1 hypothetical protein E3P93_03179 [Wallemia ichthyophaga]TIB09575.1 hypothetical protein E3P90_03210 [Wallemia ichthyophaga]TIB20378.1 hypothetical protein E3P89_03228 [Wallemia ichthyophaga]TIB21990.1 hypothetical protein E3P88_03223 [Wallemia ichthyophaga]